MMSESKGAESHNGPKAPPDTLAGVRIFSPEIHPVRWLSPWNVRTLYWAPEAKGKSSTAARRTRSFIARIVYTCESYGPDPAASPAKAGIESATDCHRARPRAAGSYGGSSRLDRRRIAAGFRLSLVAGQSRVGRRRCRSAHVARQPLPLLPGSAGARKRLWYQHPRNGRGR